MSLVQQPLQPFRNLFAEDACVFLYEPEDACVFLSDLTTPALLSSQSAHACHRPQAAAAIHPGPEGRWQEVWQRR
jgi:hypothetical protein